MKQQIQTLRDELASETGEKQSLQGIARNLDAHSLKHRKLSKHVYIYSTSKLVWVQFAILQCGPALVMI